MSGSHTSCSCPTCNAMCKHPCWPLPAEAALLIKKGFGPRLRADFWATNGPEILVLSGALSGLEGDIRPIWPRAEGRFCTFFVNNLCQLHPLGLKPIEGRSAFHSGPRIGPSHREIAKAWNNSAAQALARQ